MTPVFMEIMCQLETDLEIKNQNMFKTCSQKWDNMVFETCPQLLECTRNQIIFKKGKAISQVQNLVGGRK